MREMHFSYRMTLTFNAMVREHYFTLRCLPMDIPGQRVLESRVTTSPETQLRDGTDGWGNRCLLGNLVKPHDRFVLTSEGRVLLSSEAPERCAPEQAAPYRPNTSFTRPGEALKLLSRRFLRRSCLSDRDKAEMFMRGVHEAIEYAPGTTNVFSTAEQAARQHSGVCQDITQVFLSLCRMEGIPCRYCAGLLEGEGASHAWAEVYVDGAWLGYAPTNAQPVTLGHLKLVHGRDHADCPLECGVFRGAASQYQEIRAVLSGV